jgi:hypothetical protein
MGQQLVSIGFQCMVFFRLLLLAGGGRPEGGGAACLAPAGALAGLAGIAYQHDEEVESVAGSVDHAVGSTAEEVAKSGE